MEIKQYQVSKWIATPVNPFPENHVAHLMCREEFKAHTYATNAQDGVYDADCFGKPVWQYLETPNKGSAWSNCSDNNPAGAIEKAAQLRQFLPFNPIPKMETTELPSPEKGAKTETVEQAANNFVNKKANKIAGVFRNGLDLGFKAGAKWQHLQPANNDYAVKMIEERIKELEQIEVYGQVKLAYDATISELHNIMKLLTPNN